MCQIGAGKSECKVIINVVPNTPGKAGVTIGYNRHAISRQFGRSDILDISVKFPITFCISTNEAEMMFRGGILIVICKDYIGLIFEACQAIAGIPTETVMITLYFYFSSDTLTITDIGCGKSDKRYTINSYGGDIPERKNDIVVEFIEYGNFCILKYLWDFAIIIDAIILYNGRI